MIYRGRPHDRSRSPRVPLQAAIRVLRPGHAHSLRMSTHTGAHQEHGSCGTRSSRYCRSTPARPATVTTPLGYGMAKTGCVAGPRTATWIIVMSEDPARRRFLRGGGGRPRPGRPGSGHRLEPCNLKSGGHRDRDGGSPSRSNRLAPIRRPGRTRPDWPGARV